MAVFTWPYPSFHHVQDIEFKSSKKTSLLISVYMINNTVSLFLITAAYLPMHLVMCIVLQCKPLKSEANETTVAYWSH